MDLEDERLRRRGAFPRTVSFAGDHLRSPRVSSTSYNSVESGGEGGLVCGERGRVLRVFPLARCGNCRLMIKECRRVHPLQARKKVRSRATREQEGVLCQG